MNTYLAELQKHPKVDHEPLMEMFKAFSEAEGREKERLRHKLIECNLRLVVSIAKGYKKNEIALEELTQEGNIGLMKAVERFDHTRGFRFSTYATWWIRQAIGQFITKNKRPVRLPAHAAHLQRKMMQASEEFRDENDREPTQEELQEILGASKTVMKATMNAAFGIVSLQDFHRGAGASSGGSEPKTWEHTIKDTNPNNDPEFALDSKENEEVIREVMKTLAPRESCIIRLRFALLPGMEEEPEYYVTEEELEQIESGEGLT